MRTSARLVPLMPLNQFPNVFNMSRRSQGSFPLIFSSIGASLNLTFDPLMTFYNKACFILVRVSHVNFQLKWSISKILTFETLCDPLTTCYNIAYVLSWLECHTYTFKQVTAQLEHFKNVDFRNPFGPLNDML